MNVIPTMEDVNNTVITLLVVTIVLVMIIIL